MITANPGLKSHWQRFLNRVVRLLVTWVERLPLPQDRPALPPPPAAIAAPPPAAIEQPPEHEPSFCPISVEEVVQFEAAPAAEPAPAAKTRAEVVQAELDTAWGHGWRTYAELIKYVETSTGTGTSKRVVAAWKRAKGY
jgi:hypothetical protein